MAQFDAMLEAFLAPEEGLALVPRLVPPKPPTTPRARQIRAGLPRADWRVRGPVGTATLLGRKSTILESDIKKLGLQRPR